jgi:hypothetical protein
MQLRIPGPFSAAVEASGFVELPITFRHAAHAGGLPHIIPTRSIASSSRNR